MQALSEHAREKKKGGREREREREAGREREYMDQKNWDNLEKECQIYRKSSASQDALQ